MEQDGKEARHAGLHDGAAGAVCDPVPQRGKADRTGGNSGGNAAGTLCREERRLLLRLLDQENALWEETELYGFIAGFPSPEAPNGS